MTTKTPATVLKLALVILNRHRQSWELYEAECEQAARQGFRPHYCFHGVNMWVDYDCACFTCEEYGASFSYETYARFALDEASRAYAKQEERIDMLVKLLNLNAPINTAELGAWATEPVQAYFPKTERKVGYAAFAAVDGPPF